MIHSDRLGQVANTTSSSARVRVVEAGPAEGGAGGEGQASGAWRRGRTGKRACRVLLVREKEV
ncbi:hypothetical protein KFK09_023768 [Dendrobium nobile]|uniref:Uncharacterized protein n=1 Tax=Dendrobium nobile TaxID=94219 RepID=A0A8T3AB51_DENNO|nr:hypothetical protein KFK09_023768 [Dendrobium nobile]